MGAAAVPIMISAFSAMVDMSEKKEQMAAKKGHSKQFGISEKKWKEFVEQSGEAREASKQKQLDAFAESGDILGQMSGVPAAPPVSAQPVTTDPAQAFAPLPTTGGIGVSPSASPLYMGAPPVLGRKVGR